MCSLDIGRSPSDDIHQGVCACLTKISIAMCNFQTMQELASIDEQLSGWYYQLCGRLISRCFGSRATLTYNNLESLLYWLTNFGCETYPVQYHKQFVTV